MLLTSFDVWTRQYARGRTYFTVPKLRRERLGQAPEPGCLYDVAYNDVDLKPSDPPRSPEMTMRQKYSFDLDYFQRFIAIERNRARKSVAAAGGRVYRPAQEYLRVLLGMHLEVHPGALIPKDLLSGPFESEDDGSITVGQEKAQRLFWLVRGGACLQEDQTWESTRDGFKAILQLIKGSADAGTCHGDGESKLTLATQLVFLFSLLGVFASQWPKCTFSRAPTLVDNTVQTRAHAWRNRCPPNQPRPCHSPDEYVSEKLKAAVRTGRNRYNASRPG